MGGNFYPGGGGGFTGFFGSGQGAVGLEYLLRGERVRGEEKGSGAAERCAKGAEMTRLPRLGRRSGPVG